jgi:hypothetical protein
MKKISFFKFLSSEKSFLNISPKKNKIKVALILFISIFIFSILTGCNESPKTNDNTTINNQVKILDYNVTTEWETGCKCDNTYEYHIKTGFYNTIYRRYAEASYFIRGEIKNIAEKKIKAININVNFLAKNGTALFDAELLNATYQIYNLSKGDTQSFEINVKPNLVNYDDPDFYNKILEKFQIVESLEFKFSA